MVILCAIDNRLQAYVILALTINYHCWKVAKLSPGGGTYYVLGTGVLGPEGLFFYDLALMKGSFFTSWP